MDANSRSIRVTQEFLSELNDVAGIHAMALVGIIKMAEFAATLPARAPDSTLFVGHGDPNTDAGFAYQRWPIRSLGERLAPQGPVVRSLGQQWVVMVASKWNDCYRALIADALGIGTNELKDAAMADINRMRNDVVHHHGIATSRNSGRCEVFRWFADGDPIHILPAHVAELMAHLGQLESTRGTDGSGLWKERYEPGDTSDPSPDSGGAAFAALVDVCGFLPRFLDDGTWKPSAPIEMLVAETLARARGTYETIVELVSTDKAAQAAMLTPSLFEDMAAANWIVLHREDPDWLLQQFADHHDAIRLFQATGPEPTRPSRSDFDIADLNGRHEDLRSRFGGSAERPWWGIDQEGEPITMSELVTRLAAAEEFYPRLRGEAPVLEEQYAVQRSWAQVMHHTAPQAEPGPNGSSQPPQLAGPNSVGVLFSSYWVFSQLIYAALELGAPAALAPFERLFLAGVAVFGEAVGSPVPWADELASWAEE